MGLTLIDLLSSRLNFTYELFTSRSVGIQINGSWTGLVGLLLNKVKKFSLFVLVIDLRDINLIDKEIDLIADRVPILPKYIDEMDVSIPLGQDEWVTLQKYTSSRDSLSGLLSPFKIEVNKTILSIYFILNSLKNVSLLGLDSIGFFRDWDGTSHVLGLQTVFEIPTGCMEQISWKSERLCPLCRGIDGHLVDRRIGPHDFLHGQPDSLFGKTISS